MPTLYGLCNAGCQEPRSSETIDDISGTLGVRHPGVYTQPVRSYSCDPKRPPHWEFQKRDRSFGTSRLTPEKAPAATKRKARIASTSRRCSRERPAAWPHIAVPQRLSPMYNTGRMNSSNHPEDRSTAERCFGADPPHLLRRVPGARIPVSFLWTDPPMRRQASGWRTAIRVGTRRGRRWWSIRRILLSRRASAVRTNISISSNVSRATTTAALRTASRWRIRRPGRGPGRMKWRGRALR